MKPSHIFGLLVRTLGLVFLYRAISLAPIVLPTLFSGSLGPILGILWETGWPLLAAYFLLWKASWFVHLTYPNAADDEEE